MGLVQRFRCRPRVGHPPRLNAPPRTARKRRRTLTSRVQAEGDRLIVGDLRLCPCSSWCGFPVTSLVEISAGLVVGRRGRGVGEPCHEGLARRWHPARTQSPDERTKRLEIERRRLLEKFASLGCKLFPLFLVRIVEKRLQRVGWARALLQEIFVQIGGKRPRQGWEIGFGERANRCRLLRCLLVRLLRARHRRASG